MRPKDLRAPFRFDERMPLIKDHIFHVPLRFNHHELFSFPGWGSEAVFGNEMPIHLEFCSGNGDWIVAKAKQDPTKNWVAVEMRFDRVRKIWSKMKNEKLSNMFAVCGEGFTFSRFYVPDHSIEEVFINFPDPWPKRRHHKNRLIQKEFLDELARILRPEKRVTFVTDDEDYLFWSHCLFFEHNLFKPVHKFPYYLKNVSDYGGSWFENFWKERGKTIYHIQYESRN